MGGAQSINTCMSANRIIGTLEAYYESGSEGVYWAMLDNSKSGYGALNILKNGDYLFVENGNGGIEWEGTVVLDENKNKKPHLLNPAHYQQQVLGHWVHGLHVAVPPERWATWFFDERPAVLIKGGLHATNDDGE